MHVNGDFVLLTSIYDAEHLVGEQLQGPAKLKTYVRWGGGA